MNILVIGNGFDLAHGLPTSYKDLLVFIEMFRKIKRGQEISPSTEKELLMHGYLSTLFEQYHDEDSAAATILPELDDLTNDNVWIDYFQTVRVKDGWIDFEKEIAKVIQALDSLRHNIDLQIAQGKLCATMSPYEYSVLKPILDKENHGREAVSFSPRAIEYRKHQLITDLNKVTRCLEIYLSDYVAAISIDTKLPDIEHLDIQAVLSFNYSDTYQSIYGSHGGKEVICDHIHGRADINNTVNSCNMIIGIDEYLTGDAKDVDNEFIEFKKFYQRILKGTGAAYSWWIERDPDVYFYGHSLDVTDKDILVRLFSSDGRKTVFYLDKESLGKQIANLVKIIGQEALIKQTGGVQPRIVFRKIQTADAKSY